MKKLKKAFTLVEMLVVIVLLTMLIATAVFSYKSMIISIKHTKKDKYNELYSYHQIKSSIGSMTYYVVNDYDDFKTKPEDLYYFFYSNSESCKYITKNPLFSEDISVVLLSCKKDTLSYSESLLYETQNFLHPDIVEGSKEIILYSDLDSCEINYQYKGSIYSSLEKSIPDLVILKLKKDDKYKEFYFKIKSDRTISKNIIKSQVFDEQ